MRRPVRRGLAPLALALAVCSADAWAARLPVRAYGSEDGLPQAQISCIVRDSRGFLWFCTLMGLARFDGQQFVTYGADEGFSGLRVNRLIERSGVYWIATNGAGAIRWEPEAVAPAQRLVTYRLGEEPGTNRVNVCYQDGAGRLWAGTDAGLFRLEGKGPSAAFQRVALDLPDRPDRQLQVWAILEDGDGLWLGTSWGLVRWKAEGAVRHVPVEPVKGADHVFRLLRDDDGTLWIGHDVGLFRLEGSSPRPVGGERKRVLALLRSRDGILWVGTDGGLARLESGRLAPYGATHGLDVRRVVSLAQDREGNLWLGTLAGVLKIVARGFTSFDEADGLADTRITQIFEDREGALRVSTIGHVIHGFDGHAFHGVRPNLRLPVSDAGVGRRALLQDREGDWWIPTGEALYRFPGVRLEELAHASPRAIYTQRDGLAGLDIDVLFEDSRRDIWIGTHLPGREVVTRWERATGRFHRYSDADGLTPFNAVLSFVEDRRRALWMGFWGGGLARYRDGRFTLLTQADGLPAGSIRGLFVDDRGRLWFASEHGPGLVDDPDADRPRARATPYRDLRTPTSRIAADAFGRLYFATGRGVDRLDPKTGCIKHYTKADGAVEGPATAIFRSRDGSLWFGSGVGLSRLVPVPDTSSPPPPVWIGAFEVAEDHWPLSDLGQVQVSGPEVSPDRNHIHIDFFGLAEGLESNLRYRYKLEGADRHWTGPTRDRGVTYARLAPGRYRFVVEALGEDDRPSAVPATVSFVVLAPLWQRPWFFALVALLLGSVTYLLYRHRLAMLLQVERVRTGIASDLHDDIGSGLSRIAILSELVRRTPASGDGGQSRERVAHIADISRELVDSMSDIVWAINPRRDSLAELSQRMRRFASDVFTALEVSFRFSGPSGGEETRLGADLRRHVLLIFKEGVNNIAKHSRCTQAAIDLGLKDHVLYLRIEDNGQGLGPLRGDGHGLVSMAGRARALGGRLEVRSQDGRGTALTLTVPLKAGRRRQPSPLAADTA
jgi:ligand-binding sensor domain-containing protein/signal transduction histidine kinase